MVKDFLRKLVAIVAILFLFCLAFCFPATIAFSNEIVEALFKSKAVWLMALVLVLCPTEKKATNTRTARENNNTGRTAKAELHETAEISLYKTKQAEDDDETLISPR